MTGLWDFLSGLFDTSGFPARWSCGTGWTPELGWLHIISDLAIFGAYAAIPATLALFLVRRREISFPGTGWLFVAFILSCGIGHLIEAVIFYHPVYRLAGVVKLVTAVVSWATVIALVRLMPTVLKVPSIHQDNIKLQTVLVEKERESRSLERSRDQLEARSSAMILKSQRIQAAFEAAEAVSVQWELRTGKIIWHFGAEKVFDCLGVVRPVWENWTDVITEQGLEMLQAVEQKALNSREAFEVTLPVAHGPPDCVVRVLARCDSPGGSPSATCTGMFRFITHRTVG